MQRGGDASYLACPREVRSVRCGDARQVAVGGDAQSGVGAGRGDELVAAACRSACGTRAGTHAGEERGARSGLLDAFSARSREVAQAAERFRAKWGRAPERGELRALKLENRKAKTLVTNADLQAVWDSTAAPFQFTATAHTQQDRSVRELEPEHRALADRVEDRLTERAAMFEPGELRAVLLEQSVGELAPGEALAFSKTMIAERRVLPLQGGMMTTLTVRAREEAIERRFSQLSTDSSRDVGDTARGIASRDVAERIGGALSEEQAEALQVITGPERGAILIGPAGTGKGVVIDAAARAEQATGHQTFGIAVSGSTAQRLGQDSPALAEQTLTLDALVSRVNRGRLHIGPDTTIYLDEAGMGDTDRLEKLTEVVERTGAKLVGIGDGAQLPSIGARRSLCPPRSPKDPQASRPPSSIAHRGKVTLWHRAHRPSRSDAAGQLVSLPRIPSRPSRVPSGTPWRRCRFPSRSSFQRG